jgi:hypothetical protein
LLLLPIEDPQGGEIVLNLAECRKRCLPIISDGRVVFGSCRVGFGAAPAAMNKTAGARGEFGQVAGLALIVLGMVRSCHPTSGLRAMRGRSTRKKYSQARARIDLALAALLVLFGARLLFYLGHTLGAHAQRCAAAKIGHHAGVDRALSECLLIRKAVAIGMVSAAVPQ